MAHSSKGAFDDSSDWSVDVDTNTNDGRVIVNLTGPSFFVDFWAADFRTIGQAAAYLRNEKSAQAFRLGTFSGGLFVDFKSFGEGKSIFVVVSAAAGSTMAYELSPSDCEQLGNAFENVARQLRV